MMPHFWNPPFTFFSEKATSQTSSLQIIFKNSVSTKWLQRVNKIMRLNNTFPQWSLRDWNTVTSKWLQKICSVWWNFMIVTLQSWASLTVPYHIWERWPPCIKNLGSISWVPYENRNSSLSPNRNTSLRLIIQYHVTK